MAIKTEKLCILITYFKIRTPKSTKIGYVDFFIFFKKDPKNAKKSIKVPSKI